MFPYINVFSLSLPTYGLISVIGVLVSGVTGLLILRKRSVDRNDFLTTAIVAAVGLFIGAHLLYALTRMNDIVAAFRASEEFASTGDFVRYILDLSSGMVFYGGLYGGLAAGVLWAKHKKYDLKNISDVFAVVIPLFHVFGRIGCFFAGCCYGIEHEHGIAGRVLIGEVKENTKRLPVQLIEAFLLLLLFAAMLWLFLKAKACGRLIYVYLIIYAVMRFILEFYRGDEIRGKLLMFSTSQWISILTLLWVSIYLAAVKIKKKKTDM